jgi:hypothetical protein
MVDTWATVGSCAQIGKNVHLSGGVGIGGVLEPLQANPTIIEDNCFIGARSEVVEGVIVEENSVLGMGVYLGQSTPIFNRETGDITYGRVPAAAWWSRATCPRRRQRPALQHVCGHHREAGRCADAQQDQHQRPAPPVTMAPPRSACGAPPLGGRARTDKVQWTLSAWRGAGLQGPARPARHPSGPAEPVPRRPLGCAVASRGSVRLGLQEMS